MGNHVSAFQDFPGENLHPELAGSQGWQARGPRPLHPLTTPVQGGPAAAATAPVRAGARTARSSATSAWTQPRTPSSACAATSSGQYPFRSSGGHVPSLKKACGPGQFWSIWVLIHSGPKAGDLGPHPRCAAVKLSDLGQVPSSPWAPCPHR